MAKRRRRRSHRRGFGDIVSVPSFSGLGKVITNNKNIVIGGGVAIAGGIAIKYLLGKFPSVAAYVPSAVQPFMPAISAALTGVAAYALQKRKTPDRATKHLAGALAVSAGLALSEAVAKFVPSLAGYNTQPDFGVMLPSPMGVMLPSPMSGAGSMGADADELQGGF